MLGRHRTALLIGLGLAGAAAAAGIVAATWGRDDSGAAGSAPPPVASVTAEAPVTSSEASVTLEQAVVLTPLSDGITLLDGPDGSAVKDLDKWTLYGTPMTLLATGQSADGAWFQVIVPFTKEQASAWVPAAAVTATPTTLSVHIFLAEHELQLRDGNEVIATYPVAVGAADTPTPVGLTYITDALAFPNADGVYGSGALGLAAYSQTLESFQGAPPQIAIHGTNSPELIGQNVSNGCIRVTNEAITELARLAPVGTPVTVWASREDA